MIEWETCHIASQNNKEKFFLEQIIKHGEHCITVLILYEKWELTLKCHTQIMTDFIFMHLNLVTLYNIVNR